VTLFIVLPNSLFQFVHASTEFFDFFGILLCKIEVLPFVSRDIEQTPLISAVDFVVNGVLRC